ncbi:hypothetical protein GLOTRDRAFT_49369 [Gloeophyllum trabeum ATCC 11539]|uniref:Arrestin-like N-terminal domain-containing protein n=1 Tax=Gloeophyllum trabeum (strain ATCC 11539 / FP-39264 / Madison 617) TaxID=670483 RepID=S7RF36_GLOTA|nr:uncharacterized protein GLOTRDRAFT_49369 [Gloeophyllum trabeum ATCC 11539]EPQ51099.1 hypothetical protein GLOTRDRAFT_49369 [Gloeophyllum trabeum ATCC 11539]
MESALEPGPTPSPPYHCVVLPPPDYASSSEAPSYTSQPSPFEETLDFTARPRIPIPTGQHIRKKGRITLVLDNQDEGAAVPTYRRNALISGEVRLESREDTQVVSLEGKLSMTVSEGFSETRNLLSESLTIWDGDGECPYRFPFDLPIPASCRMGDAHPPSPPSYQMEFPGVPGLFVKVEYTLVIAVTERTLGIFKRTKCTELCLPLNYYPRSRPHRPILSPSLSFRHTMKVAPEEWFQVTSTMPARTGSGVEPLDCHLFIPAVQIYGISDTIPFYVQLRGPAASLLAFLPTSPACSPSPRSSSSLPINLPPLPSFFPPSSRFKGKARSTSTQPTIRVFLYRQVAATIRGQKTWRPTVLGEGKLRFVPSAEGGSLDWEGEVRCRADVAVGGFRVGPLVVKDFIVLSLVPPDPETSGLVEHQHAHPIRLVTDSYAELLGPPPEAMVD